MSDGDLVMKTRNVLLVIQPAYPERIQGIARFAKSHGWVLTIVDRLARFPRGWQGDGALVTLRGNAETNRFVKGLVRSGVPVVDLTYNHPEIALPRVSGDHAAFGRLARAHFAEHNFRHFAWFSTEWSHVHALRYEGFCAGAAPKVPPARWVLGELVEAEKIDDWRLFLRVMGRRIKEAPKPLAVLTYDDTDAAKFLSATLAAGFRVPEEVAIMGIGNDAVVCENQAVPLSSVDHDLEANGYEGAALLDRLMTKKAVARDPAHVALRPSLALIPPRGIVVRRSTDTLAADDPLLSAALHEIERRLATRFGVGDVAAALGISRTRLDQLFAERFSRSVGKEIVRQRIARAKKLLVETDKPIKEIASLCGFCNAGYLTNTLRAATGQTPKELRG